MAERSEKSEYNRAVAAVVVFFNPPDSAIVNLNSFHPQVDHVYIIDNSETQSPTVAGYLPGPANITCICNHENKGIAAALNQGASMAIAHGYEFLLTLDQDTFIPRGFVSGLVASATDLSGKIGILAPSYSTGGPREGVKKILFTMTSGNLLNLGAWREVGPFLEELFVDHVDHEYCLRLNLKGYSVIQVNSVSLEHRPGDERKMKFAGGKAKYASHSPLRLYYFIRNGFHVSALYARAYPRFRNYFLKQAGKELIKILLGANRARGLKMAVRAVADYRHRKFGKLKDEM